MPLAALRLGIVGLGAVTQLVYEPILRRRTDLFDTVAVAELSATLRESIGHRLGVAPERRHGSVEEMIAAGGLDAVIVLSSGSHGDVVDTVTAAGVPVFVEKPLAWTHAEIDQLASRADLVQVGYMKRFDPALQRLVELLAASQASVRAVEVTVLHPSDARQVAFRGGGLLGASDVSADLRAGFAARTAELEHNALGDAADTIGSVYSDVLLGSLIHDLAVIRPLVGNPTSVSAARVWPEGWNGDRMSVAVDGEVAGGAQLSMRWHYMADYPVYDETVRVHTETGTYTLNFPTPYLLNAPTVLTVNAADGHRIDSVQTISHVEAFEAQLEDFHAARTQGRTPTIGLDEARADVVTCQRIASALATSLGLAVGGEAAKDTP